MGRGRSRVSRQQKYLGPDEGPDIGDGGAGVREPRRPLGPAPTQGAAVADPPEADRYIDLTAAPQA